MNFLRSAYYALPPVVRRVSRRVWYLPLDLMESVSGRRDPMVPPRGRIFIGSGDFVKAGESIKDQLVNWVDCILTTGFWMWDVVLAGWPFR